MVVTKDRPPGPGHSVPMLIVVECEDHLAIQAPHSLHYLVFEDVGQVATSLTYLHITIPLNFINIDQLIIQYTNAILDTKKKVTHIYK